MSWLGLTHKGTEVLYSDEWNRVVDGLDILYNYLGSTVKVSDLPKLPSDVAPDQDNARELGKETRAWKDVYAYYGYFKVGAYVGDKPVLKDGDPVITKKFIDEAYLQIQNIYSYVLDTNKALRDEPISLDTWELIVGTSPIPLSSTSQLIRRLHIKVPSDSPYLIYVGNSSKQEFILEPKDILDLEVRDPSKVYVKSLGNVKIFIVVEK